jgi:hypothetical protein
MYPQKSAIWPVRSFPETANKIQMTLLFSQIDKIKMSSLLAQPYLRQASLKTDYKSINDYN